MNRLPDYNGLSEEAWRIVRRLRDRATVTVARPESVAAVSELTARGLVVFLADPDRPGVLLVSDHPDVPYADLEPVEFRDWGPARPRATHQFSYLRAALERAGYVLEGHADG